MRKSATALFVLGLAATAAALESANRPFGVSGYGFADFRAAYYSRGQIVNAEPILPLYGLLRFHGGEFGHLGASVWAMNAVREVLDARGNHQDRKDLTIGTVGFSTSF